MTKKYPELNHAGENSKYIMVRFKSVSVYIYNILLLYGVHVHVNGKC